LLNVHTLCVKACRIYLPFQKTLNCLKGLENRDLHQKILKQGTVFWVLSCGEYVMLGLGQQHLFVAIAYAMVERLHLNSLTNDKWNKKEKRIINFP